MIIGLSIVLTVALCVPFLAGCGNNDSGSKEPYKIGVVLSESGNNESLGKAEKASIQLFVDQTNAAGGINGHQLEVTIKDDASDPSIALEKTNEFIADGVLAVVGSSGSGPTLKMKDATAKAEIPQVCMAAGNSITEGDHTWIFRTPPTDAMAAERALTYIRDVLKKSNIAILYDSNSFGTDGNTVMNNLAPKYNINVVASESYNSNDTEDQMDTHLTNIQSSNPEVLVCWGTGKAPAMAAKRMQAKGMTIPYVGSHGIANQAFIDAAGDAANGVVLPAGKMLVWQQALDPASAQYKLVKDFAEAYKAKTGVDPSTFAGHGWDAFLILEDALKRAGDNVDAAALRDAIEETRGLVGTAGTFNFSPENHNGLVPTDLTMVKIDNGKFTVANP
jgi:branched-chain amino acid transport system substrate-binding protein